MVSQRINVTIDKEVFNYAYLPYLHDQTREQIFYGGSSSGKSVFISQRAIMDIMEGGRNYLFCRAVAKTLRRSCFNELTKIISDWNVGHLFKITRSELMITCANGYQILFGGLDDVDKLKSITPEKGVITDIVVEESTEISAKDLKQLKKRLRGVDVHQAVQKEKRTTLLLNPILKEHWIYKLYFAKKMITSAQVSYREANLSVLKTTYKDNKFLTAGDIWELENEQDEYFYEVYTLGNWGVLGHIIFKNWKVKDLSGAGEHLINHRHGLDFGFTNSPSGVVVTHYDKKRKIIYIYNEHYETGLTNDQLAVEVKAMIGGEYIRCDSAEPKSIQELKNHGVSALAAKKGKDSIIHGINWLKQQTIIIDKTCVNMKTELSQYHWKEDKGGHPLNKPVDKYNHLIDALRYAYEEDMTDRKKARFHKVKGL